MKTMCGMTSFLLASLVLFSAACNKAGHETNETTATSDTGGASSAGFGPAAPDTSAPPPLAPAAPDLAKDTVPLRAPDGSPTRYGIETGRIVQRFTGNSTGERRITFANYGTRERREENTVPNPPGSRGAINNIISIVTLEENAYADTRTRQGWKRKNEGFSRFLASPESAKMSMADYIVRNSGAERLPDTTISGYQCKVLRKHVNDMTITNWIWRGIVIREHVVSPKDSVQFYIEPVEITPNIQVPDSTFAFPAGYKIDTYVPPSKP